MHDTLWKPETEAINMHNVAKKNKIQEHIKTRKQE